jgi:hypothetical protein
MKQYDDYLRWLYRGGHPNRFARLQNRASAMAFAAGIAPWRVAALEITGRRSGRVISFPVVIANVDGERYLVSMLEASRRHGPVASAGRYTRSRLGRRADQVARLRACRHRGSSSIAFSDTETQPLHGQSAPISAQLLSSISQAWSRTCQAQRRME